MLRVRDAYGPAAILDCSRTGSLSMLHSRSTVKRLLYMFGGCTELWSNVSAEAEVFSVKMTYGAKADYKSAAALRRIDRRPPHDRNVSARASE